ncbi:MAG: hypothetical protein H0Z37_11775 [Firmicutes bacterium]|nr:hypothetical protein [Bacillota bacterium]
MEGTVFDGRTDLKGSASLRLQGRTAGFPWRLFFDGRAVLEGPRAGDSAWEVRGEADRFYVRGYLPAADIAVGKQAVNWGVGYAWAPTDVFTPPDPVDPSGPRPGIWAAVVHVPVGPLDYWSAALAEDKIGVRRRGNRDGTDWSVVAVSEDGRWLVGGDLKGDWGIGWHAAAAVRTAAVSTDPLSWEALLGADYSWLAGRLLWIGEYRAARGDDGREQHMFQQVTYRPDEVSSVYVSGLFDLSGGEVVWSAGYGAELGGEARLELGVRIPSRAPDADPSLLPRLVIDARFSRAF